MTRRKNRHEDYEEKLQQRQFEAEQEVEEEDSVDVTEEAGEGEPSGDSKLDLDYVRMGLLGVIALTLIVNTFMGSSPGDATSAEQQAANAGINPNPNTQPNPFNNAGSNNPVNLTTNPNPQQTAAPKPPSGPPTTMQFATDKHDFGTIKQNSADNTYKFKFTNTGKNPLLIQNAAGSCGCTVPKWPKEPIPPGGTAEIEVDYKPGMQKGTQTKTITITANTEPPQTTIHIKADVEEEEKSEE